MPLRKKPLPRKRIFRKNVKEKRSEFSPARFKDQIEVIGKIVLGIVAFCYAVGILVESLYLGSFGVYHVSIFRFTYVLAGAWAVFIFIFPILIVLVTWHYLLVWRRYPFKNRVSKTMTLINIVYFAFSFIVIFMGGVFLFILKIELGPIYIFQISVWCYVAFFLAYLYSSRHRSYITARIARMFCSFTIVVFFAFFLGNFANFIFPQISARFGGGKPLTVQLLLEANKQNAWMIQKNFDLCESDRAQITSPEEVQLVATKPMPLLLATDTDYVIRKDETTAISISRDQVKTVLYLDNFDYSRDVCGGDASPKPAEDTPPA